MELKKLKLGMKVKIFSEAKAREILEKRYPKHTFMLRSNSWGMARDRDIDGDLIAAGRIDYIEELGTFRGNDLVKLKNMPFYIPIEIIQEIL